MFGWLFALFARSDGTRVHAPPAPEAGCEAGSFRDIEVRTINLHPLRCRNCREPLRDGEQIVTNRRGGRGLQNHAHARCAILVKWTTGVRWLDGTLVSDRDRTKTLPILFVLLADECRALGLRALERPVDAPKSEDKA